MGIMTLTPLRGGRQKSLECRWVQEAPGAQPLGGLESLVQSPQERTQQDGGRGEEGTRQAGIGKAAGGVKICRWRDVRMPGKREDPDHRQ